MNKILVMIVLALFLMLYLIFAWEFAVSDNINTCSGTWDGNPWTLWATGKCVKVQP